MMQYYFAHSMLYDVILMKLQMYVDDCFSSLQDDDNDDGGDNDADDADEMVTMKRKMMMMSDPLSS